MAAPRIERGPIGLAGVSYRLFSFLLLHLRSLLFHVPFFFLFLLKNKARIDAPKRALETRNASRPRDATIANVRANRDVANLVFNRIVKKIREKRLEIIRFSQRPKVSIFLINPDCNSLFFSS